MPESTHNNLQWNHFYLKASKFSESFKNARSEKEEAQIFWIRFFEIFDIKIERIKARFESNESRNGGFIDFLWKSKILIEHKSKGKDLNAAFDQASEYFSGLPQRDLPTHICVCDFEKFKLIDLVNRIEHQFCLNELADNIKLFAFLLGYKSLPVNSQEEVNVKAAKSMGLLHRSLIKNNYKNDADILLTRLLFCFFAENTGIFKDNQFIDLIVEHTQTDGSDLGPIMVELFQVLNTKYEERLTNRNTYFKDFPYVNGNLFEKPIVIPAFTEAERDLIIKLASLNWSKISPDIFGNIFQSALTSDERHDAGAHYTSEDIIQRVIKPSFLDNYWDQFFRCRNKSTFQKLHEEISSINIFDPACGCGNFLIISYIELRRLENAIIQKLSDDSGQGVLNIETLVRVSINQFYGIEIDPFAAEVARVSMWLAEHQMNIETGKLFGQTFVKLPLDTNKNIINKDALTFNWAELCSPFNCIVVGNPPYLGKSEISESQKIAFRDVVTEIPRGRTLDYVSAWLIKASNFIAENSRFSFVVSSSICQGEQNEPIWKYIFERKCSIFSAHKPFSWKSNGPNAAAVDCIIISLSKSPQSKKYLYEGKIGDPILGNEVKKISNYLTDAENIFIESRNAPISNIPEACFGCMPNDNGGLIFSEDEKNHVLKEDKNLSQHFKVYVSGKSSLTDEHRFCLWAPEQFPSNARNSKILMNRIEQVRKHRSSSNRTATQELADYPYKFGEIRYKNQPFIFIPRTSSENRSVIPMSFFDNSFVPADSGIAIFTEEMWLFSLLQSKMHAIWVQNISGRLTSRLRYSINIVYNNFPVPHIENDVKQKLSIAGKKLLEERSKLNSSLEKIYDPKIGMPVAIGKAHDEINFLVDKAYGFGDEDRFKNLVELYLSLSA